MRVVCASTNCKYSSENEDLSNVIFINFPNDDTAKLWAHNCGRPDLMMKSNEELHLNHYICSHHLEDRCYISRSDPIIIEQGSLPTLFRIESPTQKEDTIHIFDRAEQIEVSDNVYCDMDVEIDQYHDITIRFSNLCRICGESTSDGIEIFAAKGIELRVKDKISLHMPVSMDVGDLMPQKICMDCYNKLEITHSLVITCLRTDMRLRRFLNIEGEPEYDNKYNALVEECSLQVAEEMCTDETTQTESLPFASDKVEGIVSRELEAELKQLGDSNMQDNNFTKNGMHPELSVLIPSYKEPKDENPETLVKSIEHNETKGSNSFLCLHCKDTFKTQEIFENHKILCDEGETMDLEKQKKFSCASGNKGAETISLTLLMKTCSICQQVFESKELFDEHKISYCKPPRQIRCQICGQLFASEGDFSAHKRCHVINNGNNQENTIKRCGHCNVEYCTRKELLTHITECHKGQSLFKCFACEKTYEKWSSLDVHEATHRVDKPYLCDLCGKSFKHSNNLRGHKRIHLDESKKKRHVCEVCGNAFRSRFHLREHMNQHDGNKPYSCEQCGKAFYKRIQLRQHKLSHGLNRHVCPICGVTFNRRGNMNTHLKRHSNGNGVYTCSVCACRCKSMSELKMHRKKHTEQDILDSIKKKCNDKAIWQCKVCDRIFSKRTVLANHERVHGGEKISVECDECGKKLANKSSLIYHKKSIHSRERPYICQYCGEAFVSKETRLIHERIHTGERPYICKICNMQYRCSSNLSQHMKIHSGVRPHKCSYCSKGFTRKGALNVHERIHTGVKPFPCEICGRTFSQKNDMLKHTKTHNVKSMQCEQCNEVFTKKKDILKHLALHEQNTSVIQEYVEVPQKLQPYTISIPCSRIG